MTVTNKCLTPTCTNEGLVILSDYCEACYPKREDDLERRVREQQERFERVTRRED